MKLNKKSVAYILIGLAIVGIAAYFLFFRNGGIVSLPDTGNAEDEKVFRQLHDLIAPAVGPSNMNWIYDKTKSFMTTGQSPAGEPLPAEYKINGAITKAGAFMWVYNTGVASWLNKPQLHEQLWQIFYKYRADQEKKSLY